MLRVEIEARALFCRGGVAREGRAAAKVDISGVQLVKDLREVMTKSRLCVKPWEFSDRKKSRHSQETAVLRRDACARARVGHARTTVPRSWRGACRG